MNSSAVQWGLLNMFRNFPVASHSEEERGLCELTLYCGVLEQVCLDKPASFWSFSGIVEAKLKASSSWVSSAALKLLFLIFSFP